MYCCDVCGKPMPFEYVTSSFSAHKYIVDSIYGNSKWVHGNAVDGYQFCNDCADIVDSIFKHRNKIIEELDNEA